MVNTGHRCEENVERKETEISCPFCGEDDFDKPGLKDHLLSFRGCHDFENTENL
jgi:hypothetical protein